VLALVTAADAHEANAHLDARGSSSGPPFILSVRNDSADVVNAIARFHAALTSGDSVAAISLLAPEVMVLETGEVQTLTDYRAQHLPGDIAYAQAVPSTRSITQVVVRGDVAWVSSTSVTQGEYRGRPVNSAGAELVVLTRNASGGSSWKISAIHWSSRARR